MTERMYPAETLLAWHNDPGLKRTTIETVHQRIDAGLLRYRSSQRHGNTAIGEPGGTVACTVGTCDHSLYPARLGLPVWVAYLQDRTFAYFWHRTYANLPRFKQKLGARWTLDVLGAIPVGARVDDARGPILARILEEIALPSVAVDEWGVRDAIRGVVHALRHDDDDREGRLSEAGDAARAAARATIGRGFGDARDTGDVARAAMSATIWRDTRNVGETAETAAGAAARIASRTASMNAWVAARPSARDAAGDAAWVAAGGAAMDAAWDRICAITLEELSALNGGGR